jgi:predicted RecB family nuclease
MTRNSARIPKPSPGDIFFDFEGDPFVGEGGLEFLFGYLVLDDGGKQTYVGDWASAGGRSGPHSSVSSTS